MKLQQLRYAVEVYRRNLNVSDAADALFTSQPGVSKQIRLLEDELGVSIFIRSGKRIVAVTPAGLAVLEAAEQMLRLAQNIKNIGHEFTDTHSGALTIAATHHWAHYQLPRMMPDFMQHYPDVRLILRQGSPSELTEMVRNGDVDLAVGADIPSGAGDLKFLPCGTWCYALCVPNQHDLTKQPALSLGDVLRYPLLTYDFTWHTGSAASRALAKTAHATVQAALQSDDAEILKQYVRLGLGVALLDKSAYDINRDADLTLLDIGHCFEPSHYQIALHKDILMRNYLYDFIALLHSDLTHERVQQLLFAPAIEDFSI
ncbi:LysR substrate-binding domain-containing protein [Kingella kingae]|uniref:LysR substrate-binding domain-containing protein n=1 Tax=Kingella kingae TaxID=504 RepID=UPI00254CD640|nr:LysR substrate-binding domain-containing protein [Kingella kingae]MDK4649734.1 LysR substrate-binding domain-containing protein [Kingella kingae]